MAQRLRAMLDESSDEHEFEIRVSLDGVTAEQNDSVRGEGALDRAMAGIRELLGVGIRPTVATTATWGSTPDEKITRQMQALMAEQGVEDCPIKIFPNVLLGAEEKRLRTYREGERVTAKCVEGADPRALMCSNSRLVTERGAWVCTLLANIDGAKMGETIADTMRPFKITEGACYTCFTQGVRCSGD
jgi:hypothetical protein